MKKSSRTLRAYLLTWLGLLVLLGASAGLSQLHLGPWNLPVSLLIAAAKVCAIGWVFMELREAPGLVRLASLIGLAVLSVLFLLSLMDFGLRLPGHVGWQQPKVLNPGLTGKPVPMRSHHDHAN